MSAPTKDWIDIAPLEDVPQRGARMVKTPAHIKQVRWRKALCTENQ